MLADVRRHEAARVEGMLLPTIHAFCMPVFDAVGELALAIVALGRKARSTLHGTARSTPRCAPARRNCLTNSAIVPTRATPDASGNRPGTCPSSSERAAHSTVRFRAPRARATRTPRSCPDAHAACRHPPESRLAPPLAARGHCARHRAGAACARRVLADAQPRRVHAARARRSPHSDRAAETATDRAPARAACAEAGRAAGRAAPAAPKAAAPKPAPEPVLTSTQTAEHGEPPAAASAASGVPAASGEHAASAASAASTTTPPRDERREVQRAAVR